MARVAIIGPGQIGAAVASAVEATGRHDLVLCARRSDVPRAVARDGEEPVALLAPVLTDAAAATPVDWLLLAVKAHQTDGASDWLRQLTGPGTTVVVLQNGVRHRERVAQYVGDASVVPASVWLPAERVGAVVQIRGDGRIRVADDESGRRFAEVLSGSWLPVETVSDFALESWRKLTANALSGLMVLAGRRAGIFREPELAELARHYAVECAAVARAEGAALSDAVALEFADKMAELPPNHAGSILLDREKDRPLEWHARNGIIRDIGRQRGIPTPISDVVVPLLMAASG